MEMEDSTESPITINPANPTITNEEGEVYILVKPERTIFSQIQTEFEIKFRQVLRNSLEALALPSSIDSEPNHICGVLVLPSMGTWCLEVAKDVVATRFVGLQAFEIGIAQSKRLIICDEALVQRVALQVALREVNGTPSPVYIAHPQVVKPRKPEQPKYVPKHRRTIPNTESPTPISSGTDETSLTPSRIPTPAPSLEAVALGNQALSYTMGSQPDSDFNWTKLTMSQICEMLEIVGTVRILKPSWDDFAVDTKDMNELESEVSYIVEAYDFPPSYSENQLKDVLNDSKYKYLHYQNLGFRAKWINETSTLLIFSSKEVALAVTSREWDSSHIKFRPLVLGSEEAKHKYKRSHTDFEPFKDRPPTDPTTARRMISSSLGLTMGMDTDNKKSSQIDSSHSHTIQNHRTTSSIRNSAK